VPDFESRKQYNTRVPRVQRTLARETDGQIITERGFAFEQKAASRPSAERSFASEYRKKFRVRAVRAYNARRLGRVVLTRVRTNRRPLSSERIAARLFFNATDNDADPARPQREGNASDVQTELLLRVRRARRACALARVDEPTLLFFV